MTREIAEWTPARAQKDWKRLKYSLESIRDLHDKDPDGGMGFRAEGGYGPIDPACLVCGTSDEYAVEWPCATRKQAEVALSDLLSIVGHRHDLGCMCWPHLSAPA